MAKTTGYDENDLLRQVAEGNELAFEQLYMTWQGPLSSYIFRVTQSSELTAEILQDVFLKIWMSRETLLEIHHFKAYLFVMSRNHALNAFKKVMREIRQLEEWQVQAEDPRQKASAPTEPYSLLDEAIDQLSPRQKEVYLMHRYERLTYRQIAEKLSIGKESVKTHLQLAIKAITAFLKDKAVLILLLTIKYF